MNTQNLTALIGLLPPNEAAQKIKSIVLTEQALAAQRLEIRDLLWQLSDKLRNYQSKCEMSDLSDQLCRRFTLIHDVGLPMSQVLEDLHEITQLTGIQTAAEAVSGTTAEANAIGYGTVARNATKYVALRRRARSGSWWKVLCAPQGTAGAARLNAQRDAETRGLALEYRVVVMHTMEVVCTGTTDNTADHKKIEWSDDK